MDSFIKQPSEEFIINIDFSNKLETSETISSYAVVVCIDTTVYTSTIIDTHTSTTVSVSIRVKAGTTGNNYKITTKITTNQNNVYEKDIMMRVCET